MGVFIVEKNWTNASASCEQDNGEKVEVKDFMKNGFRWNRKGISTIIATIIIVAIAIVMAIAVAYWAMGIGGSFTRFEKLQYTTTPYATLVTTATPNTYTIYFSMKNTGTASATIDTSNIMINGQPCHHRLQRPSTRTLFTKQQIPLEQWA